MGTHALGDRTSSLGKKDSRGKRQLQSITVIAMSWRGAADNWGINHMSPVSTLRHVFGVAQRDHQLVEELGWAVQLSAH